MIACGLGLALAVGCKGAETRTPVVTTTDKGNTSASPAGTEVAARDRSLVRLVNALPSKQHLDIGGDDRAVFGDVGYKTVTPYTEMSGNIVKFRLRRTGTDSVLASNTETMTDGYRYTIIAMPDEKGGARLVVVRDEVVPDAGKARLRVINAAPGVKDADVAVQGQKDALFTNIAYAAEAGYKDLDPMTATIEIRREAKSGRTILLKNMRFDAGKAYTIVLTGATPSEIETITFDDAINPGLAAGAYK
jgi:hypothetical protein